jgi:hypothetical protein
MKSGPFAAVAAAACLLAAHAPAAAQNAVDLYKPSGPWAVDYGDDYCRLARNFSDGTNALSVAFERIQPAAEMRLILVGPDLKTYRSAEEIGWHFLPGDPARKARATQSQTADGKQWYNLGLVTIDPKAGFGFAGAAVVRRDVVSDSPAPPPVRSAPAAPPAPLAYDRAAEQAAAKAFTGFVLDGALTTPVQVDTGDLSAPVAALQACADDLAKSWGLDPVRLQTQKSPAIAQGGGSGWLPMGTVAFADFAKLGGGSNQVRVMVDATGKPTACAVHWPTLDQATNTKICKTLMANGKFTPAMDSAGQPMPGYWVASPLFLGPPIPGGRGR